MAGPSDTTYNYQLASRQTKMNEYAYQNKMDTLFFFQILFLSLLILAIFAYGSRVGFFSTSLVLYVALILLLIDILIFVGRLAYTTNTRDPEIWSRKRFTQEQPVSSPGGPVPTSTDASANPWGGRFGLPSDLSGVDISGLCAAYTN
jgi:hypothetical protein